MGYVEEVGRSRYVAESAEALGRTRRRRGGVKRLKIEGEIASKVVINRGIVKPVLKTG